MDNTYLLSQLELIDRKIREAESLLSDPDMGSLAEHELRTLNQQKEELQRTIDALNENERTNQLETVRSNLDRKNVILEVKGAAGGDEAKIWGRQLLRMYLRFAEMKGFRTEVLDEDTIKISAPFAFGLFKYEAGVHRVQRIPETEKRGRIHTSTAVVSVLPELEDVDLHIRDEDIDFEAFRSGGHGGQNVNKVSTAVRLRHNPSGIVVTCQTERSQNQNREYAMKMLRAKLWEIELSKRSEMLSELKSTQVGKGMRAEKIRTYNFPQDRVTDHRVGKSYHNLPTILDGTINDILSDIKQHAKSNTREVIQNQHSATPELS